MGALTLRRKPDYQSPGGEPSLADDLLDEILPEEVDWRQLVWNYPKGSLALALLGGYFLGRSHGHKLVRGASRMVGDTVTDGFNEFFGRRVL